MAAARTRELPLKFDRKRRRTSSSSSSMDTQTTTLEERDSTFKADNSRNYTVVNHVSCNSAIPSVVKHPISPLTRADSRKQAIYHRITPNAKLGLNQQRPHKTSKSAIICLLCTKEHPTHTCRANLPFCVKADILFNQHNLCTKCAKPHHISVCRDSNLCRKCNQNDHPTVVCTKRPRPLLFQFRGPGLRSGVGCKETNMCKLRLDQ